MAGSSSFSSCIPKAHPAIFSLSIRKAQFNQLRDTRVFIFLISVNLLNATIHLA